jgi:hypothetical protein
MFRDISVHFYFVNGKTFQASLNIDGPQDPQPINTNDWTNSTEKT